MDNIDFKIVSYIAKNNNVHINQILNKFKNNKFATKYRLETLISLSIVERNIEYFDDDFGGTITKTLDTYYLTDKGKVALQNYKNNITHLRLNTFKYSFLYPILAAIITAYITTKYINH